MFCDRCGATMEEAAGFCPRCGKAVGSGVPLMPRKSRLAGHIRLLGILWLAVSTFRLIPGFFLIAIFRDSSFPPGVPMFVHTVLPIIGLVLLCGAVIGGIVGVGLLTYQPWARMLAIIFGALNLVDLPFGTAIGIYTLWVLLPVESEQEYRTSSRAVESM